MANADRPPARDLLDAATLRQIGLSAATLQRPPPVYQHIFRALERAVTNGALQPRLVGQRPENTSLSHPNRARPRATESRAQAPIPSRPIVPCCKELAPPPNR